MSRPLSAGHNLSRRSREKLKPAHNDLAAVVYRASEILRGGPVDFRVGEVERTIDRQRELVASGASKTMNSRHIPAELKENGEWKTRVAAVDLFALDRGKISWAWPHYHVIAAAMKQAAAELDVALEWGGDWRTFKDGPHFQLSWRAYPRRRA